MPGADRNGNLKGPVRPGGAVPRLMAKYSNLWADISAGSGYNALSRDPSFTPGFLDQFQDKLMFGTDCCTRSSTRKDCPIVDFFPQLLAEKKIGREAWDKIAFKNACRLMRL
jgi:hypothetical protein